MLTNGSLTVVSKFYWLLITLITAQHGDASPLAASANHTYHHVHTISCKLCAHYILTTMFTLPSSSAYTYNIHTCVHLPTRYCPPCALCTLYAAHQTYQHVHCTLPSAHHQESVHCAQKNIAQNSISKESHEQCKRCVQVCSAFQLPAKAVIKQHHHYSLFIASKLSPPL